MLAGRLPKDSPHDVNRFERHRNRMMWEEELVNLGYVEFRFEVKRVGSA